MCRFYSPNIKLNAVRKGEKVILLLRYVICPLSGGWAQRDAKFFTRLLYIALVKL